jgi:hypothetical protein
VVIAAVVDEAGKGAGLVFTDVGKLIAAAGLDLSCTVLHLSHKRAISPWRHPTLRQLLLTGGGQHPRRDMSTQTQRPPSAHQCPSPSAAGR